MKSWRGVASARLLRLIGQAVLVATVVGVLSFLMTKALPGNEAYRIAAARYGYDLMDSRAAEAVRIELGLDQPAWRQLTSWLGDLLQLRLGVSMVSGDQVVDELAFQLGATLALSLVAWVGAVLLSTLLGTLIALRPHAWSSQLISVVCTALRASPAFLIGVVLMLGLAVHLQWLPVAGHGEPSNMVLPALTLALTMCPGLTRVVQTRLSQVLHSASFEFAQFKGMSLYVALWRHAAAPVALLTLAYAGVQLLLLIEGVVVVESLFAWPGIGHALVHAVIARDVPVIQGAALVMGLLFVVLNTAIEWCVHGLDPRLRSPAH